MNIYLFRAATKLREMGFSCYETPSGHMVVVPAPGGELSAMRFLPMDATTPEVDEFMSAEYSCTQGGGGPWFPQGIPNLPKFLRRQVSLHEPKRAEASRGSCKVCCAPVYKKTYGMICGKWCATAYADRPLVKPEESFYGLINV